MGAEFAGKNRSVGKQQPVDNGVRSFTFNRAGRLASSGSISYLYDGHGRRILKNNSGSKTYSLYSQQGRLISTIYNGAVTDYIYLGGQLVARHSNNQPNDNQPGYIGHPAMGFNRYVSFAGEGYRAESEVSPFAAFGRDVWSAGFGGGAKSPENVAAWVIGDHKGVNIERLQTHSNRHFDSAPIFVMGKITGDFYEYEFDSETEEWTCSKNGEEC